MDEPESPPDPHPNDDDEELERIRELILRRRNRFIAAALAGLGAASSACGDSHTRGEAGDVAPQPRSGGVTGGTRPSVCLEAGFGGDNGGAGAGVGGIGGAGAGGSGGIGGSGGEPSVCLSAPEECWNGDQPPCVCLEPPIPDDDAGV